jgi:hypothetical protein
MTPWDGEGSLPPLGGRLLLTYRVLWASLAAAAVAVLVASIVAPPPQLLILGLRLLKAGVVIAVAAILFRRRQRDAVAALLSLALLLWTITSSVDFTSSMSSVPVLLDRFRFLLFTLALLLFPDGRLHPRWTRHVALATFGIFVLGVAEAARLLSTHLFLPLAIPCVLGAIGALIVHFRSAPCQAQRQQLKWVALGLVSGIGLILCARAGAALTAQMVIPAAAPILFEALFQAGIVLVALGFLVSLLRYRLFDAEAAISRSVAFGGLTLALVGTFAGGEALIEAIGQNYFGMGPGNVAAAIAAAVAAVLLSPLHNRISSWAEQYFQRDLVALKTQLPELLAELSVGSSTLRLGTAVLPRLSEAIHAKRAALVVNGSVVAVHLLDLEEARSWIAGWTAPICPPSTDCNRADALFPVRIAIRCPLGWIRAWLLLGPRPDGSLFGKDEIDAIQAIMPGLRQALFASTEREAQRARVRRFGRVVLTRLRHLSSRIEELESGAELRQRAHCGG